MAELRTVSKQGSITMQDREYFSEELVPYIGKQVKAFVDVDDFDVVCFDVDTGEFITNAKNPELWEEMMADIDQRKELTYLVPLMMLTACFTFLLLVVFFKS